MRFQSFIIHSEQISESSFSKSCLRFRNELGHLLRQNFFQLPCCTSCVFKGHENDIIGFNTNNFNVDKWKKFCKANKNIENDLELIKLFFSPSSFVEFQILLNTYTRDNNDIQQARWENYFNKEDNKIKFIVEHGNNLDKNMKENFLELLKNMRKAFIAYKEGLESFLPSERRSAKKSSSSSSPSKISDFMSDDNLIKLQKEVKKFQLKVSLSYNQLSVEVDNDESMGVNDNNEEEEQKDEENIEIVSDHTKYWVQKEIEFDYKDISNDLPPFKDNFEVYFVKESKDSILDSFNFSLIINSEDTLMWFDSDRHQIKLLCPPKGDYIILDQNGEELQSLQYKDLSDLIKFDEQLENETSCWQLLCAEKINKLDGSKKFIKIFFSGIHSAKE